MKITSSAKLEFRYLKGINKIFYPKQNLKLNAYCEHNVKPNHLKKSSYYDRSIFHYAFFYYHSTIWNNGCSYSSQLSTLQYFPSNYSTINHPFLIFTKKNNHPCFNSTKVTPIF